MGAMPMGEPGCPEFARWTASMTNVRMVVMQSWSISCDAWIISLSSFLLSRCCASCKEQCVGMPGNHQILVGGHHTHRAGALLRADDGGMTLILLSIELDPEIRQPETYLPAHRCRMLADPPCEHERVQAAEDSCQRADGLAQLIAKHVNGLSRIGVVRPLV